MDHILAGTPFTLTSRYGDHRPQERDGRLVLRGEIAWLLRGPADGLDPIAGALPGMAERFAPELLLLDFGNAVGRLVLPGLPPVEIVSGKWGEGDFAQMLDDLTTVTAGLPFAAAETAGLPYDRSVADQPDVLFHLFTYLRHVMSDAPPPEHRLLPALRLILREPHQRFVQDRHVVPAELARTLDSAGMVGLVTGAGGFARVPPGSAGRTPVARALRGHLPQRIDEPRATITRDTPENRFVKAFLDQAAGIIDRTRRAFATTLDAALRPIAGHTLWGEVGRMIHLPAASPVLQRRRGYREVYGHFGRLRLATRLPLDAAALRDLLAAKDIAHLFELWSYFILVAALTDLLGQPAVATQPEVGDFQIAIPWDFAVTWPTGVRLLYNPRFSRKGAAVRRSYSVSLRPDIALVVPSGRNAGLHLLDAKFRLERLADTFAEMDGDTEEEGRAAERRGTFKRADLYKMHTYRDAIPGARSVWILYPGTEARFFADPGDHTWSVADGFPPGKVWSGVGAFPLAPHGAAGMTIGPLLASLLGMDG
jgi:predicted component of viral defense system (DUF524 family)